MLNLPNYFVKNERTILGVWKPETSQYYGCFHQKYPNLTHKMMKNTKKRTLIRTVTIRHLEYMLNLLNYFVKNQRTILGVWIVIDTQQNKLNGCLVNDVASSNVLNRVILSLDVMRCLNKFSNKHEQNKVVWLILRTCESSSITS